MADESVEVDSSSTNLNGSSGERDENPACCREGGQCGPDKVCGKYFWTIFNIMAGILTLGSTLFLVFAVYEFVLGNRITYLNAYVVFSGVWLGFAFIAVVLTLVFSGNCKNLNYATQQTAKPKQFQYGPIRLVVFWQLVSSTMAFSMIAGYAYRGLGLNTPEFDALNTVSSESAAFLSANPTLLLKWNTLLLVTGLVFCVPAFMLFLFYMHCEMYPVRAAKK